MSETRGYGGDTGPLKELQRADRRPTVKSIKEKDVVAALTQLRDLLQGEAPDDRPVHDQRLRPQGGRTKRATPPR